MGEYRRSRNSGTGEHFRPHVERHHHPPQHQEAPGVQLVVGHGHAVRRPRPGQPHEVLGADVRGEDRCADDEPPEVPPGQKVIGRGILPLPDHPPGKAEDDAEVGGDHQPVDATENGHSETSLGVNVSEFESISIVCGATTPAPGTSIVRRDAEQDIRRLFAVDAHCARTLLHRRCKRSPFPHFAPYRTGSHNFFQHRPRRIVLVDQAEQRAPCRRGAISYSPYPSRPSCTGMDSSLRMILSVFPK